MSDPLVALNSAFLTLELSGDPHDTSKVAKIGFLTEEQVVELNYTFISFHLSPAEDKGDTISK